MVLFQEGQEKCATERERERERINAHKLSAANITCGINMATIQAHIFYMNRRKNNSNF
jgi:hypothetical protein